MNQPLVTVVTATYNLIRNGRETFFRQSVESVHNQTYGSIEHLIIDGASCDGTRELIAEYEEKGWVTCVSEPDSGIYDAMNKGTRLARGKYIAFLNTDDFWSDANGIAMCVHMLEMTQSDYAYSPTHYLGEHDAYVGTRSPMMERFFCELPFCHQSMLCRTELLRERGGFDDKRFRIVADYDFMQEIILSGKKGVYVPLCFTSFRLGGMCSNAELDKKERFELFRHFYAPLIGTEAAEKLNEGIVPDALVDALSSVVDAHVREQMQRRQYSQRYNTPPSSLVGTKWSGPLGLPLLSLRIRNGRIRTYKLFGFLPIIKSKNYKKNNGDPACRISLFGFLPLWTTQYHGHTTRKHYLFGFLPIGRSKRRYAS